MNELIICKYESLPECEQEIHNEAHKRDMITSTNNSVVSILYKIETTKLSSSQYKKLRSWTTAKKNHRGKTNATASVESRANLYELSTLT